MSGQEGDTRQFKRLRSTDFYYMKAAAQAEKREPKRFPRCKTCGQEITEQNYGGYCMRCHNR